MSYSFFLSYKNVLGISFIELSRTPPYFFSNTFFHSFSNTFLPYFDSDVIIETIDSDLIVETIENDVFLFQDSFIFILDHNK